MLIGLMTIYVYNTDHNRLRLMLSICGCYKAEQIYHLEVLNEIPRLLLIANSPITMPVISVVINKNIKSFVFVFERRT